MEFTNVILLLISLVHVNHNITHRDIKPGNLMLDSDFNLKIIDFGVAEKFEGNNDMTTSKLGTICFNPPELFNSNFF